MDSEPTAKLFHYTKKESALEHILPSGRIRLSHLPRTNDPRESLPVMFTITGHVGDDQELTSRDPFELIEEADQHLRASAHLLCLTEDRTVPSPQHGYGNGRLRARMWAQYGGNHSGVSQGRRSADDVRQLIRNANETTPAGLDPVRFAFDGALVEHLYHGTTPPPEPAPEVQKAITNYKFARAVHRPSHTHDVQAPRVSRATSRPRERREQQHTARSTSSGDSGDSDLDGPGSSGLAAHPFAGAPA